MNSESEWREYNKSGNKPNDIPVAPHSTYANSGWVSMGDWLGTGRIADQYRKYREFHAARKFVRSLGLRNGEEWLEYCRSGKKPEDLPNYPHDTYREEGWQGIGDWLGTGNIANHLKQYIAFDDARKFVHSLNLKNVDEWVEYCKSGKKPDDIPRAPAQTYKGDGWAGYGNWLGTGTIANFNKEYTHFEAARKFVHSLKLKSETEWRQYCKSGKKPEDIPTKPARTYKKNGWQSMGDWLGTGTIAVRFREYRNFPAAREFAHSLNFKNQFEWYKYCQSGKKPNDIPTAPQNTYRDKGWLGFGDWLGTKYIANSKKTFREFEAARDFVRALSLKDQKEWYIYRKSGKNQKTSLQIRTGLIWSKVGLAGLIFWGQIHCWAKSGMINDLVEISIKNETWPLEVPSQKILAIVQLFRIINSLRSEHQLISLLEVNGLFPEKDLVALKIRYELFSETECFFLRGFKDH